MAWHNVWSGCETLVARTKSTKNVKIFFFLATQMKSEKLFAEWISVDARNDDFLALLVLLCAALLCIDHRESVGFYAFESASVVHPIQIRWVVSPALMAECIFFFSSVWHRFASLNRCRCAASSCMNLYSTHRKNFFVNLLKKFDFKYSSE